MPRGATPSRWCVCQFHHFRTGSLSKYSKAARLFTEPLCTIDAGYAARFRSRKPATLGPGHQGYGIDVAFRPDGRQLVSGGEDGTVRVWDVATRTPVARLRRIEK